MQTVGKYMVQLFFLWWFYAAIYSSKILFFNFQRWLSVSVQEPTKGKKCGLFVLMPWSSSYVPIEAVNSPFPCQHAKNIS